MTRLTIPDIIAWKRDGQEMTEPMIERIVLATKNNSIAPAQLGAWLMACQIRDLNEKETLFLTKHMIQSGEHFEVSKLRVDKHSTGGVGDKMSLILAPCLHASGFVVPMLAGRGLAHTGGTIDKLESIPGFNTGLSMIEMQENPCFISRQTDQIAPTDKIMYATRDVTATVPCIGLITASIISKKAAEGLSKLVLDVKCGKAGFMTKIENARLLAKSMVRVSKSLGIETIAQITSMDEPIGNMIGNAHEVVESINCLKGVGPQDTMELVTMQAEALGCDVQTVIANGKALQCFKEMCLRQGVNSEVVEDLCNDPWSVLPKGAKRHEITAKTSGFIHHVDALAVGKILAQLGAGRLHPSDNISHGIGLEILAKKGQEVSKGETIAYLDVDHQQDVEKLFADVFEISPEDINIRTDSRLIEVVK